jgi:arylsulfatase A-like enzyme
MERREFARRALAALAAASLPGSVTSCASGGVGTAAGSRPNIVFIMADDLGYGDVGFTGRTDYATPAIDRIAREGVVLTQSYSAAPVCTPTRVALMTGRFPARNAVGLYEPLTTHPTGLDPRPATLARWMRDAGYETGLVGKWHLGLQPQFHPMRHGFDEFFGFLGAAADYRSHLDTEALAHHFHDGEKPVRVEGYLTDLFTDRAVQFVSRPRDKPFFLNLQYNAPHWPWQGPGDPVYPDSLRWSRGGSQEVYARMMESLDRGVGRVLDALRDRGIEQNTLVVFTSDNGGERFSHMGPFSQGKMTLYEGGIRVAAAARWPALIPAGSRTDQVSVTMDWSATMASLAGAIVPNRLDGMDLTPALTARAAPVDRELYWRISQRRKHKAVRRGQWKYLHTEAGEFLFDLGSDPGERANQRAERPAELETLKGMMARWESEVLQPIPLDPRRA